MKITMSQHSFICPDCKAEVKEYIWSNEITTKKVKCGCKKILTHKNLKPIIEGNYPAIRTDTKNR